MPRLRSLPLPCAALALLASCTSTVAFEKMVPEPAELERSHELTVQVQCEGSPDPWIGGQLVADDALHRAVVQAIEDSKLFEAVVYTDADVELRVRFVELEEPEVGLDQTARVELDWRLTDSATHKQVWHKAVKTEYTADTLDADFMAERERLAIERALQKNIQRGVLLLSKAEIQ